MDMRHPYDVADSNLDLGTLIFIGTTQPSRLIGTLARNRYGPDIEIWGTESGWSDGIETALGGKNDVGRLTCLGGQPVLAYEIEMMET